MHCIRLFPFLNQLLVPLEVQPIHVVGLSVYQMQSDC